MLDSTQVEPQAKWQLAAALGGPEAPADNAEPLLARFANDADEYVRRRALQSLARHGSALVEDLASREWYSAAPDSPWTKMNALWALHRVKSARFDGYRAQALLSEDELLRSFAERLGVNEPSG